MLSGCYQLMWAHSHLMWFLATRYYQLMWSRKTDVIGSCDLYYRAATINAGAGVIDLDIVARANAAPVKVAFFLVKKIVATGPLLRNISGRYLNAKVFKKA